MSIKKKSNPTEIGSTDFSELKKTKPVESAAGIPGIFHSLRQAGKYMNWGDALKASFKLNQKNGFDCPGCAWPDPDDDRSSFGEYCENGIKAIAEEAQEKSIGGEFFDKYTVTELGQWTDYELGKAGRLSEPLRYDAAKDKYVPIEWADAYAMVAKELNGIEPDEAIFYTSGRTSNEAAFLYQLFVRQYGTNNLPDCSNMCHECSGVALSETLGIGKGSTTLTDFYEADVVMILGQNPGTNHPRMLSALKKCKDNGGKIIAVNPLKEAGLKKFVDPKDPIEILKGGTQLADIYLQLTINGDVALLKAMMKILLEEDKKANGSVIDHKFIEEYTAGYEELINDLENYDIDSLCSQAGLSREEVERATKLFYPTSKIIICWAMGITQHKNGVDNIREIVNLLLLKGAIGKSGAGTCPVRGHSNVQGDRTVGIWESPPEDFLDRLEDHFGFPPPRHHGYAVVDAIQAMHSGNAGFFFAMGGNFLSAAPDTKFTAEALRNCSMTVQVSTKLNRSHLVHGTQALILPCLGRTNIDIQNAEEQFVSVENSMGIVHSSKGPLPPPSDKLKSEVEIISELADHTFVGKSAVDYIQLASHYDNIRDAIEVTVPGFDNYNERVRQAGGFYLPNGARERVFNTDNSKANFSLNRMPEEELEEGQFFLMTIRSHDQYNTTIYRNDDRYRGIRSERRVILMNEDDMKNQGLSEEEVVNIKSIYPDGERVAENFKVLSYEIPPRCVASYFPEANVLVPANQYARKAKTPISKKIKVEIYPVTEN